MRVTKVKQVGLYNEIERKVARRLVKLPNNILYRMVIFNSQKTLMADCKDD